ncbi:TetR family transcriptional regulator [Jatrophihabitans sp. DSM 45814]
MIESAQAFQRARSPEHKHQRYEAILAAARTLALREGVRTVTLTDIAAEVGVHKSALLRYFETREEIYLKLTAEGWNEWARAMHVEIDGSAHGIVSRRTGGYRGESAVALATALSKTLTQRPLFCDLLAHAPLNLERNVSLESVRNFKIEALTAVDDLAALVTRAVPELGVGGGRELIAAISNLAGSLWQIAHPPETLVALYAEDPQLAHAAVDFEPRLSRLALVLTTGLLSTSVGTGDGPAI